METQTISATPIDAAVNNQTLRVQIPVGLNAGDTLTVTLGGTHAVDGTVKTFTVIVPENAFPGSYIEVVVPIRSPPLLVDADRLSTLHQATAGAALVGAVVGTVFLGPLVGILLAGGAAAATVTAPKSKINEGARDMGQSAYTHTANAANWLEGKIKNHDCVAYDTFVTKK
jgi:hypothetical protein